MDENEVMKALEEVVTRNARLYTACNSKIINECNTAVVDVCTESIINAFTRHNSFQKARFYDVYNKLKVGGEYKRG